MSDNIVKFRMPDGSEVSNDPRWVQEQMAKAQEELLASRPNSGNVGIPDDEMAAQIGRGVAPLQSGQPGVGDKAVIENPDKAFDKVGGRLLQTSDKDTADQHEVNPATDGEEVPDSNEAVLARREAKEKAQADYAAAMAQLGDDAPQEGQPYSEWSGPALKAELKRRNAMREAEGVEPIDTSGVRRKAALAELLEEDDRNSQQG